jgi:streptogramin lyase
MAGAVVPVEFLRERRRAKRLARWRKIKPRLAWGSLALALVVGVTFGVVTLTRGPGPVVPTVNQAATFDPATGKFTEAIPVGDTPNGVAVGERAVWVINQADETVQRIDPGASNPVVATKSTGGAPTGIAAGEGAAWITTGFGTAGTGTSFLYRYELSDNSTKQYVALPFGTAAVAAGLGSVWAVDNQGGRVIRVDPKTQGTQKISVAEDPNGIAVGPGSSGSSSGLWVTSGLSQSLSRIEVEGAKTHVTKFDVGVDLKDVTLDDRAVWAVSDQSDLLLMIDPSTGRVEKRIKVPDNPVAVTEAGGDVWVASYGARTLSGIDPKTGRIVQRVPLKASPADLATDSTGKVWVVLAPQG